MKISSMLGLALALALLAGLAGTATADTCQSGCGLQVKACLQTGRTAMLACKLDCRTNSGATELRPCVHGCRDAFATAKATCRGAIQDCVASCVPPPPPGGDGGGALCVGSCGQTLATCAHGVIVDAKACAIGCSAAADRLSCLESCAAAAKTGAEGCARDFTSCVGACGGSPSGAFIE